MQDSCPDRNLMELLPAFTIDAAVSIFEDELLGSIEPGKQPGLNLITGYDPDTLTPAANTMLRVLV
jgi:predicted amidohydrolase YtcJ